MVRKNIDRNVQKAGVISGKTSSRDSALLQSYSSNWGKSKILSKKKENPFSILGKDITTYFSSVPFMISMITKRLEQKVNHLAQLISTHKPKHTLMPKIETFGEKVKRRILEENKEPTTTHDKQKQQLKKVVSHDINELPTHYSATLQNKLPPKETNPGSFILPCFIRNHSMGNALADLGASISVMTYSLFKRLGLGSLRPIKMTIEMADRSMQSPKGIKENVLVKISNFGFLVDFIILDIMEDENVPIILGRPKLATAHLKIDVYGKKISLGVGNDQVVFNINKKESPTSISPICVIKKLIKCKNLII
ncbi:putative reverse transcriptase, RNA-dependent DNA polymerase [Tanacetum coccineum]